MPPSIHRFFQAVCSTGVANRNGGSVALRFGCRISRLRSRSEGSVGCRARSNACWMRVSSGERRPFARIKSNSDTKSPWGRGVSISASLDSGTGSSLMQRFFFWAVRFDSIKRNQKNQKLNPFSGRRRADASDRRFIFRRAGGGQKSGRSRARTGGLGAHTFSANCEIFFLTVRAGALQKFAAKFRVGGVGHVR